MGIFASLFGPSETKTTTKVDFPDWVESASKKNYNLAETIASRPYTPYPFERVAGFTGDQSKAMSMLRNMAPMAKSAMGPIDLPRMFEDVGRGGSTEAYMNPYIDNVMDRTMGRIRQATDYAKQWEGNTAATGAGAFGDARHGIADALIEERGIQQMGDAAATGYAQAYDNAMGMKNTDINRMLQMADFNRQGIGDMMSYIDSLYRSGSNQQALNQQGMSLGYEDFMRQLNYPVEQYNLMAAALNQSPYGKEATSAQPGPSMAAQGLSAATGIGSLLTSLGLI